MTNEIFINGKHYEVCDPLDLGPAQTSSFLISLVRIKPTLFKDLTTAKILIVHNFFLSNPTISLRYCSVTSNQMHINVFQKLKYGHVNTFYPISKLCSVCLKGFGNIKKEHLKAAFYVF